MKRNVKLFFRFQEPILISIADAKFKIALTTITEKFIDVRAFAQTYVNCSVREPRRTIFVAVRRYK
jgi:hypothetical protein